MRYRSQSAVYSCRRHMFQHPAAAADAAVGNGDEKASACGITWLPPLLQRSAAAAASLLPALLPDEFCLAYAVVSLYDEIARNCRFCHKVVLRPMVVAACSIKTTTTANPVE